MKRKNKKKNIPEISPEEYLQQSLLSFKDLLTPAEFSLLAEEIQRPLLTSIRINPLKTGANAVAEWQVNYHWQVKPIPFCEMGYWIDDSEGTPVSQTLEHRLGSYYIQEAASMLPVQLFDIDPADPGLTLDLAASPGGKTTHLVSRQLDRGLVMANDSSAGRIPALRIVLQNWGAVNTAVSQFPGEKFGGWFPETFDRVLIDAPCSMQGLRTADSHTSRPVTDKESKNLSHRQTALLASALQAARVGGQVVYSTCTLLPAEDEEVIDSILHEFGSSVRVVDVQEKLPSPAPGILENKEKKYDPEVQKSLRLWPHRMGTAGFFACLLEKQSPLDLPTSPAPVRPLDRVGFMPAAGKSKILQNLQETYGFELESILTQYSLSLMQRYEKFFVFPNLVLDRFSTLPLEYTGMLLGEMTLEGILPSHEWVSRFGSQFTKNKFLLEGDQLNHWLRGEDIFGIQENERKKTSLLIVCAESGQVVGRGKLLKDRLKNLLPHRLI